MPALTVEFLKKSDGNGKEETTRPDCLRRGTHNSGAATAAAIYDALRREQLREGSDLHALLKDRGLDLDLR